MLLKIWKITNESTNGTWVAGGLPLNQWPGQALLAAWSIFGKAHMLHGAGIFTYKTGWFLGHMLVNIPYMEHMGYRFWMFIIYILYIYIYTVRVGVQLTASTRIASTCATALDGLRQSYGDGNCLCCQHFLADDPCLLYWSLKKLPSLVRKPM